MAWNKREDMIVHEQDPYNAELLNGAVDEDDRVVRGEDVAAA